MSLNKHEARLIAYLSKLEEHLREKYKTPRVIHKTITKGKSKLVLTISSASRITIDITTPKYEYIVQVRKGVVDTLKVRILINNAWVVTSREDLGERVIKKLRHFFPEAYQAAK